MTRCLVNQLKLRPATPKLCCAALSLLVLAACGDDDEGVRDMDAGQFDAGPPQGDQDASDGPAPDDGSMGNGDRMDAAADGSLDAMIATPADATADAAPDGEERGVLRPESREPTDARIASLEVPPGFALNVFARDVQHARMLAVHEENVYLTRPMQGDVLRLVDGDGDGVAETQTVVASDLPSVHGITIDAPNVYLATPTHVYRAMMGTDGALDTPVPIIDDLPAGGQHPNRTLAIGPDRKLYISVGSPCDACPITDPEYATILRAELDGSARAIFASGLRNTIGFGFHPSTSELWGMDHGSDWRGNDVPPEELNLIEEGNDYGWPYCFGERQIDPIIQDPSMTSKQAYCAETAAPVLQYQAHEAPIAWAFYRDEQFPESYRGNAFVAFRGSWNRIPPTGYKIAHVVFENDRPARIEDFVTGFLVENGTAQFGRLSGVAVASDGSLLFTDDENGYIYRVSYVGTP